MAAIVFQRLTVLYLNSGGVLQRLESSASSPLIWTFSETLEGLATIRAFGAEARLIGEFHTRIDTLTKVGD